MQHSSLLVLMKRNPAASCQNGTDGGLDVGMPVQAHVDHLQAVVHASSPIMGHWWMKG
jgi:hypothetical protein